MGLINCHLIPGHKVRLSNLLSAPPNLLIPVPFRPILSLIPIWLQTILILSMIPNFQLNPSLSLMKLNHHLPQIRLPPLCVVLPDLANRTKCWIFTTLIPKPIHFWLLMLYMIITQVVSPQSDTMMILSTLLNLNHQLMHYVHQTTPPHQLISSVPSKLLKPNLILISSLGMKSCNQMTSSFGLMQLILRSLN